MHGKYMYIYPGAKVRVIARKRARLWRYCAQITRIFTRDFACSRLKHAVSRQPVCVNRRDFYSHPKVLIANLARDSA